MNRRTLIISMIEKVVPDAYVLALYDALSYAEELLLAAKDEGPYRIVAEDRFRQAIEKLKDFG